MTRIEYVTREELIAKRERLLAVHPRIADFRPGECHPTSVYCGDWENFTPVERHALEELFSIDFLLGWA